MNSELKSLINLVFDAEGMVAALIAKENFFTLLPKVFSVLTQDLPSAITNWGDLKNEIAALSGSAQEADLLAFIQSKFILAIPSEKAQAILAAILKLVMDLAQDVSALEGALSS